MFVLMVGLDQKDSYALFSVVACTAPVAELNVVLFTVPSNYCTIAATATVVTSCSSSSVCGGVCVTMSCGGGFVSPDGFYDSVWDSVRPMIGNTPSIPFSTLAVECVCMLNDWFSNDEFCADNYHYFRFMLKGKGRSELWELYLHGDKTIKMDRSAAMMIFVPTTTTIAGLC